MNKKILLVGISGKIGSGKDTVANVLYDRCGSAVVIRRFAAPLKAVITALTGLPANTQEDKLTFVPEFDTTVGNLLQVIGTELFREHFDEDVWVKALLANAKAVGAGVLVIPDVRFENEFEAIRTHGGILIRVEGDPAKVRENSKRDLNHISETALDDVYNWDYKFHNTGTLDELKEKLQPVIDRVDKFIINLAQNKK